MAYNAKEIEEKWQAIWEKEKTYLCDTRDFSKPKYYILDMFPYPSAAGLHVGHVEGYTASDVLARLKRTMGYNVLHPMGFDSFGLPSEQYAISNNVHPGPFTDSNIDNFRRQLKRCGFSYDWSKEIKTSDPSFYRWTQWIFVEMFKSNLAYISNKPVNYCPELMTVLANEEVVDGKSERGGYPVIRMNMEQWNLKITAYADRLLKDLKLVDWPSSTVEMQKNWIGESEGVQITFTIVSPTNQHFDVYTTRVDTLFGCTYCVLAPEHPLVGQITTPEHRQEVLDYIEKASHKSDLDRTELNKEKTGVSTGAIAINPINGTRIPVFIGDYVLASYGSGAVMAVPAHDERDYEFAKKHDLPIKKIIDCEIEDHAYEGDGPHINSSFADGLDIKEAKEAITVRLEELHCASRKTNYRLRDWLFSRQRYWGEPIPIIKMPDGKLIPETNLPLVLPELDDYKPAKGITTPLSKATDFVHVKVDGVEGVRETNTMPQWAGSSWYYIRYIDPHNEESLGDKELLDHWLPVDLYIGGTEHAVLHLLYARFFHKFLYDIGKVSSLEPFHTLRHQGMILDSKGEKMSKSKGNVVNPDDTIDEYGADALRLYELFKGPIDQALPWSNDGVSGARRFLDRVYRLYSEEKYLENYTDEPVPELDRVFNYTVKKVQEDYLTLHFNTAIAQMMIFINSVYKAKKINREMMKDFAKLLAPCCPHLGSEIYEMIGGEGRIDFEPFPSYDESKIAVDSVTYAVSINGKLKTTLSYERDAEDEQTLLHTALDLEPIKKALEGKEIIKTIVVKNKIINIVVR